MKSKRRILMGFLLSMLVLLIAGCSGPNRAASTPVDVPGQQPGAGQQQQATSVPAEVATLLAGGLASATAQAGGESISGESSENQQPAEAVVIPPSSTPTPIVDPPLDEEPKPTKTPKPEVDCSSPYKVKAGDWVWNIGRRCNIHPSWIISANNLWYPYVIRPGDVLILPSNAPAFPGP